jgi:hypothetical protein
VTDSPYAVTLPCPGAGESQCRSLWSELCLLQRRVRELEEENRGLRERLALSEGTDREQPL